MLFRRLHLYGILFTFFSCATLWGQVTKKLHHISFNVNDGLLHSQVTDLAEDGNGFTWISTGSGVQRFDGKTFWSIPVSTDHRGIPDDKYVQFFVLKNGNLWLRHDLGITEYNIHTNRFHDILRTARGSSDTGPVPVWEKPGGVWCRISSGDFQLLDKKKLTWTEKILFPSRDACDKLLQLNHDPGDPVFSLLNRTHIYTAGKKGVARFPAAKAQGQFIDMAEYRGDTILVATMRGIEKMDIVAGTFTLVCRYKNPQLATGRVIRLHRLPNDNYLVSEGLSVYELNINARYYPAQFVSLQNANFISVGSINRFISGRGNNIWIVSENNGICKIDYRVTQFRYYGTSEKGNNFTKTIYVDKQDNRILCGTMDKGLLVFDTAQQFLKKIERFPGLNGPHTIAAIKRIAPHQYLVFLQGFFKTYLFDSRRFSLSPVTIDTTTTSVSNLFDYHMNILPVNEKESIVQSSFAVYRADLSARVVRFTAAIAIPAASITSYIDPQERLWVGSKWNYFLFPYVPGAYKKFELPEKVLVRSFYANNAGLWMGTEKGLFQLDTAGNIIRSIYQRDGLIDDNIYALGGDRMGNLWISHNKGISCMSNKGHFIHYNKYDGLQENEFNTNCFFETPDGELFFGGVNGVSSFYPGKVLEMEEQPRLFVTSIKVKDQEWQNDSATWNTEHIELPYHKNNLSFEFIATGIRQPDQYNYQFRMLGADNAWINSSNRGNARYTLAPGEYVFELYGGNSFNTNAQPLKRISISILPPFWKTRLFISAIAVLAFTIIVLLIRYLSRIKLKKQIKELERKRMLDEERLRISREMHDDIGAGLTHITLMSESIKKQLPDGAGMPESQHQLDKIAEASRKLVSDMSEIIWSMNPEHNTLDQLLALVREQLRKLLEYSGITYSIDLPENGEHIELSNAQKRNLLLIAREIVHNIVKHSKARHMEIKATRNKNILNFLITDDGCGFDPVKNYPGSGLRNIKKRVEELNGKLTIVSTAGNGCRFSYEIPLG